ncbi:MAG: response regulator [Planctomycetes bacterium]|nr:response regulator [Planctomycetota bacterium]
MHRATILVADDDRHLRAALRTRLTALGYRVVESPDGLGVLSQCVGERVDALLLDHAMPNGDGRSIARVIRNECDAPIVFLTGRAPEEFRDIVCELPDVYYLRKPLDDGKLYRLLASILPRSRPASADESTARTGVGD